MDFYPINLNLKNKKVLIVGAGKVAFRKFTRLKKAGALISVVSPEFNNLFSEYLNEKSEKYKFSQRKFKKSDLNNIFLVFAATNNKQLNKNISRLAQNKNILVNTANNAVNSDFIIPSVVERGKLLLTVSTSSNLPALSKKIRKELESNYSLEYQLLLELMEKKREYIIEGIKDEKLRRKIFKKTASENFLNKIRKLIDREIEDKREEKSDLNEQEKQKIINELEKELLILINNLIK